MNLELLKVPAGPVDVVLDTDTFNEVDDQFALSYLLRIPEKARIQAIYAAPFFNARSESPEDGMLKSYAEIRHILTLSGHEQYLNAVYQGSRRYLPDENTAVSSPAAEDLVRRALSYSPEHPLYVLAIGAITNVASALLMKPEIAQNLVIVWLGGHGYDFRDTLEFNMRQDVTAARVVMRSEAAFVQLPCRGVVSEMTISKPELEYWLAGKNRLSDYLAKIVIDKMEARKPGMPWTKVIWDVTTVAWLLNEGDRFMEGRIVPVRLPDYGGSYEAPAEKPILYIYQVRRDEIFNDLFRR
ncbi:MAG: nucleoside hydrolase, partial [Lachnospiraceae bacterium]|nr:nucleoside hydrolase [Lachnospiraceae bacterium]